MQKPKIKLNPLVAVWEYTLACDSKCIHCGSDAKLKRKNELTTLESLDLVDQIASLGFKQIILSGGEPTLRKDWIKIAERIKSKNIEFGVISNALRWNSETIDALYSLKPFSVGFSVDGEPELHDYLRGVQGSHKKVFDCIKQVKEKGMTVCVVTSVNKRNLEELPKIRNRMIVYGVDAWQIQTASPMGRMTQNKSLVLDSEDYYSLGKFIVETRRRLPQMNVQGGDCMGYFGDLEKKIRDRKWPGCMAGIEGIGIESDGTIKGCLSIRSQKAVEGNIREQTLESIWNNTHNFKYNREFKISSLKAECIGCYHGKECKGGCQSQSIAFFDEFNHAPYCFFRYEKIRKNGKTRTRN
jgi:radical SAM protein with 4Fe4S-binding SPASM domain